MRQNLATCATAVVAATAHLAVLSRGITVQRLVPRMSELSARVRTARANLDAVARRVEQRTQIEQMRRDLQGAAEARARNRAVLMGVAREGVEDVRARLLDMAERVDRSRFDVQAACGAALRRQAASLRDSLAFARMNVELARLNRSRPPATGIIAQARAVAAKGVVPTAGGLPQSAAIGPKPVARTVPTPPASFRGTLVEIDAVDAAIRALPSRRASAILADLHDLRAAMQADQAHLYRSDRGLKVVTDDPGVRATVARIVADPGGKSILLSLGGPVAKQPSRTVSPNEPPLARYTPPTAVPSLAPRSSAAMASSPTIDAERERTRHEAGLDNDAADMHLPAQNRGKER